MPLSLDIKMSTKTKNNCENDDFVDFLFVNLLTLNIVYKQKDNKKQTFVLTFISKLELSKTQNYSSLLNCRRVPFSYFGRKPILHLIF